MQIDLMAGGFPCQPVSAAGKKLAEDDERWLWPEFARLVREVRPTNILVENVTGLLHRGMGAVLGDLAACGYDAEWQVLPAAAFGAPHLRERVFIVAYPAGEGLEGCQQPRVFVTSPPCGPVRGIGLSESDAVRSRDGIPHYVERITGLGNAVDVRVAEWVGAQILASHTAR